MRTWVLMNKKTQKYVVKTPVSNHVEYVPRYNYNADINRATVFCGLDTRRFKMTDKFKCVMSKCVQLEAVATRTVTLV